MDINMKVRMAKSVFDVASLFEDDTFTDCTVITSDKKEFKLHRAVLSQRSDFFKAMLKNYMKEGNSRVIKLQESSKVLENIFKLIYSKDFNGSYQDIMELAVVSKKYLLMDLHQDCLDKLLENVEFSNAPEVLVFACENELKSLKEGCLNTIVRDISQLRKENGWEFLSNENPETFRLVIDSYIERMKKYEGFFNEVRDLKSKLTLKEVKEMVVKLEKELN